MKKVISHQILRAALDVFTTEGFAGTTAQIAHAAGVGTGTLFRYFPTKAGLTAALFQEVEQGLENRLVPGLPHSTPPAWLTHASQGRLWQYWMQAAQQALTYPAAFQYWVLYRADPRGAVVRTHAANRVGWLARVAHALTEYQDWGQPDPARQALAVAQFAGQWEATLHYLLTRPPLPTAEPAPAVLERAFRSWWRGLDL
ncbi:TetR/AcrR family transcriptional regulator [Hymenobacter sp. ASUV-10]|uniref:TetR/AcrR family transcriptional regulator n=1 Tax=Hymenobacter aranciens TaxID=3063996 RepID=A0ABT9BHJ4_9BACT|nr:TetR/AcrR family transcriptional regulator [Hymenobacter sp. ASUV-10]MDO7877717.1 TetR/AcrR family transcriptional regulator [Hymenobacter sp. ASUV-10]